MEEAKELRQIAAGAEISLSRLGRKHKHTSPPLPTSRLFVLPQSPTLAQLAAIGFIVSAGSPFQSHTSMGGWMGGEGDGQLEIKKGSSSALRTNCVSPSF